MRALVSALVPSHLMPMVPLVGALRAAGHEVLVTGDAAVTGAAAGFGLPTATIEPIEVAPVDEGERSPGLVRCEAYLPAYLDIARAFAADLVLTDPLEHAGWIVAGATGARLVVHRYGPDTFSTALHEAVREPLRETAVRAGAAGGLPDPDLILDPCPPTLRSPAVTPGEPVRFIPFNGPGDVPPALLAEPAGRRVCVCPGVWGSGQLTDEGRLPAGFRHAIEALAALGDVQVVVTLPRELHPLLDGLPAAVVRGDRIPLALLTRHCDLVVHHGGAGTALTAAAAAVPQLVLPFAQPFLISTAEALAACGAGRLVAVDDQDDAGGVRAAVADTLGAEKPRRAAADLRAEILAMPSPADLVARLARLAA